MGFGKPLDISKMTWKCHLCGQMRQDKDISVYKRYCFLEYGQLQLNIRYCNDNPTCFELAKSYNPPGYLQNVNFFDNKEDAFLAAYDAIKMQND